MKVSPDLCIPPTSRTNAPSKPTKTLSLLAFGLLASQASSAPTTGNLTLASAFHPIKNIYTSLCLQADGTSPGSPISQAACVQGDIRQLWAPLKDGNNLYRFQNRYSELCIWVVENPVKTVQLNTLVFQGVCYSGNGDTYSDTQFKTELPLPNTVSLDSQDGYRDQSKCIDGSNRVNGYMWNCNGSLSQKWIVGYDL